VTGHRWLRCAWTHGCSSHTSLLDDRCARPLGNGTRTRVRHVGATLHIGGQLLDSNFPRCICWRSLCQWERREGINGDRGLPQVVDTLGSLGGAMRHPHATIHTTPLLASASTGALSMRQSALRTWRRGHPLVTSTKRNAFPTALYASGVSCATLGLLCGGASCATWMRLDGDASCVAIGERPGGSASCATLWSGVRNGGASCVTLLMLSDTHRLSKLHTHTGRQGPSGGTHCLCMCTPLGSNGRAGHPSSCSRSGGCPICCTSSTPRHSPSWKKRDRRRRRR
jgi:hypothetical protein